MTCRCKFQCVSKTVTQHNTVIKLEARYDTSIPEDQAFSKATPCGSFEMTVTRPEVAERFVPGDYCYLDVTLPE